MRINKIAAVMCLVCLFSACTGRTDNNSEGITSEITMETTKNTDTAEPEIFDRFDGVRAMTPFYQGNTVYGETVMFIDRKDRKQLLFDPDEILSVRSYDLKTEYVRGKDYDLDKDGRLILTEGSSISCITQEVFYGAGEDSILVTKNREGKPVKTYWGEGEMMTKWQVSVTYTHSGEWSGFRQENSGEFAAFLKKLKNGENVTVVFYGDSITYGASASFIDGYAPHQLSWSQLAVQKLAAEYGYSVHYVDPALGNTARVPEDVKYGGRGVITYINPSVGGWTVADGISNFDRHVKDFIGKYGCDLFVTAFGMNDAGRAPDDERAMIRGIADRVLAEKPDASVMLVSTMVPNPAAENGWCGNQALFEKGFMSLAEDYRRAGVPCGVTRMTSVSLALLERKDFCDYSGNNINHPNDFMVRIYAQSFYEALAGYENAKNS